MRTEFGFSRQECDCQSCGIFCRYMPGMLIPNDLERLIPAGEDPLQWAETNLLASPGAIVMKDGLVFRIPTLVPARKGDGSCIHLTVAGRCEIHEIAPFGCAFFSECHGDRPGLADAGLKSVYEAWLDPDSLYTRIWTFLAFHGKLNQAPEIARRQVAREAR